MPESDDNKQKSSERLCVIELDASLSGASSPDVEHERKVAIFDLLEENSFSLIGEQSGPYQLKLSIVDNRLLFDIADQQGERKTIIGLALSPFRRIVKDYFMICESYFTAIKQSTPSQIETIDMARRGLHNEGSELLKARLDGKVTIDFDTARRLFTLVCVLHWKG